jgi:hypothetical protein
MAQKFLPSHRKWLDYEAVLKTEVSPLFIYTCPKSSVPVDIGAFFVFIKERFLGGKVNAEIFYV